jgi:hypothetical protein
MPNFVRSNFIRNSRTLKDFCSSAEVNSGRVDKSTLIMQYYCWVAWDTAVTSDPALYTSCSWSAPCRKKWQYMLLRNWCSTNMLVHEHYQHRFLSSFFPLWSVFLFPFLYVFFRAFAMRSCKYELVGFRVVCPERVCIWLYIRQFWKGLSTQPNSD